MRSGSTILDAWQYESPGEELEAARWYLCGRLSLQSKLDAGSFGQAVYSYEWLRHAATFLQTAQLNRELFISLSPAIGEIWLADGFPKRPFAMLSSESQANIRCLFDAESPAAMIEDAQTLRDRGVFKNFESLAVKPGVKAEVPLGPGAAVIVLTVIDAYGPNAVARSVERLLEERAERVSQKRGRQLAGQRKKQNPLYRLKDLASARVFALLGYDVRAANQWAYDNQPRNPENHRRIPWFDQKGSRTRTQPLRRNKREWLSAINKFEQNLVSLVRSQ